MKLIVRTAIARATAMAMAMASMVVVFATASPAAAAYQDIEFYCAAATAPTNCDLIGIVDPLRWEVSASYWVLIFNHANYGERCQLRNGSGAALGNWVYINAGASRPHELSPYQPANAAVDIWCQRRAASGDAGIGGYLRIAW